MFNIMKRQSTKIIGKTYLKIHMGQTSNNDKALIKYVVIILWYG